ncbi:MAG: prephenate dehydrogenase/arogenate dehydrogenase family protein [Nitrospirae bacterium]|nr:prephenate dehydrogenase/arogenate dehydrogenase family protein [Nitrospirota bacterium]
MNNLFFNRVTILGVGLIGASFALALKKRGICKEIVGYGRREENLKRAMNIKIIDTFELEAAAACRGSDLILFSMPVGSFIETAKTVRGSLKEGAIVTDVGSVKGKLVRDMEDLMTEGVNFVGGHPIAGSDRSGIDTASSDLFSGAKCILTPTEKTDGTALKVITELWDTLGATTIILDPDEHDKIYAAVSHLPHIIAYAIMNTVADVNASYLKFAGQGFKDTTRIASSSPELWRDICLMNKENLIELIELLKKNLDNLSAHLQRSDFDALEREFERARTFKKNVG